jgi:hypothetical protein
MQYKPHAEGAQGLAAHAALTSRLTSAGLTSICSSSLHAMQLFSYAGLQVRTKVFKCLGCVVEADSRIMAMPEVAQAVNDAQGDDSAAVKEAVLELLVKLISTNPELASGYFDTLVQASYVSVTLLEGFRYCSLEASMSVHVLAWCAGRVHLSARLLNATSKCSHMPWCLECLTWCSRHLTYYSPACIHTYKTLGTDWTVVYPQDQGIMVRKRAIRALWECCSCRGFSRAGDAVVAVLNRANDREDSMRNLVTKICGEMWFTDVSSFAGGQAPCDVLGAHA